MSYLKSKPGSTSLLDIFQSYSDLAAPLVDYHETIMRGPSPFTPAEREAIAAYVSGLNECQYCHGIHGKVAEHFGMKPGIIQSLFENLDSANINEKLKPVFNYVKKLTQEPSRITNEDADAIYAAGWDEQALHDAVTICALFNFMNRYVIGLGVEDPEGYTDKTSLKIFQDGYESIKKHLK